MRLWQALALACILAGVRANGDNETSLTTPHDPFRALSILVVHPPASPICCLNGVNKRQPSEPEEFLSFEEWKVKQAVTQDAAKEKERDAAKAAPNHTEATNRSTSRMDAPGEPAQTSQELLVETETLSPHFRVPIIDRYNYANSDCSARVHTSHRSAKSPASILSGKKDRYMLSPCSTSEGKFVVVELCDDIRIDTVQLANFEFFSGVFQDFRVSVAKTYTADTTEWIVAGEYTAKNVRGVQSFHPPTSLRDFYRFIRIDFVSHYGAEYYCPVSLLRVYGLTHLEQWKWDEWEAESRSRLEESNQRSLAAISTPEPEVPTPVDSLLPAVTSIAEKLDEALSSIAVNVENSILTGDLVKSTPPPTDTLSIGQNHHSTDTWNGIDHASPNSPSTGTGSASTDSEELHASRISSTDSVNSSIPVIESVTTLISDSALSDALASSKSSTDSVSNTTVDSNTAAKLPSPSAKVQPPATSFSSSTTAVPVSTVSTVPVQPSSVSGESIYRTIMNRLNMLEANTTLYTRYIEEQTKSIREAFRRLEEEVGRLEGLSKAQSQVLQRSFREWEMQKSRLQFEHEELLSRINFLADEVILEKRLGIAQLSLLLTVLIFMGLTRGSRSESLLNHTVSAMHKLGTSGKRGWSGRGIRTLSFSGNWVKAFRSRSESPGSTRQTPTKAPSKLPTDITDDLVPFPRATQASATPHLSSAGPTTKRRTQKTHPRPHTPTGRHPGVFNHLPESPSLLLPPHSARPRSAGGSRPQLQRSHSSGLSTPAGMSHSVIGPVPRSARRWARSAHLHEARPAGVGRKAGTKSNVESGDDEVENAGMSRGTEAREREESRFEMGEAQCDVVPPNSLGLLEKGKGAGQESNTSEPSRRPLSPLVIDQAQTFGGFARRIGTNTRPIPFRGLSSEADESDVWLDTDADVSEAGQDVAVDILDV